MPSPQPQGACIIGVLRWVLCCHEAKAARWDPCNSLAGPRDTERRPRCQVPSGRWLHADCLTLSSPRKIISTVS
eukprot:361114-Chlamydomonas_euryale.AAC.3